MIPSKDPPPYKSASWHLDAISYFRKMNFFDEYSTWTDGEILQEIMLLYGESFFWEVIEDAESAAEVDQFLLQLDEARVWSRDLKGVYKGEDAYTEDLRLFSSISEGVFTPANIVEIWADIDDPVYVKFDFRDAEHTFIHKSGRNSRIDLNIITFINSLMRDTAYRFEVSDDLTRECRFIVVLTREEKIQIRDERGWSFCEWMSDV